MAGIVTLRRSWGRQKPPLGTPLSPRHPLAAGLVACWPVAEPAPPREALSGSVMSLLGSAPTRTAVPGWGPGLNFPATSGYGMSQSLPRWDAATRVTIAAVVRPALTSRGDIAGTWTSGVTQKALLTSGITASRFAFYCAFSSAAVGVTSTVDYVVGRAYFIVATYDGTISRLYIDGFLDNTATPNLSLRSAAGDSFYVTSSDGSATFQGDLAYLACWDRDLSGGEVLALHLDPYAIFAPPAPRRVSAPAPAAGGMVALPPTRRLRNRTLVRI